MIPSHQAAPTHSQEERLALLETELKATQEKLAHLEKTALRFDRLFQPVYGLVFACAAAVALALVCFALFKDEKLLYLLMYIVPIGIPFGCFIFDRLQRYFQSGRFPLAPLAIDSVVVALSLVRAVYELPFISGHAFFLSFALLTVKSWWARIPTLLVLIEVIYLKAFVWHDATLYGGAGAGIIAAALWWLAVKLGDAPKQQTAV
jgi:hypothetical protein